MAIPVSTSRIFVTTGTAWKKKESPSKKFALQKEHLNPAV